MKYGNVIVVWDPASLDEIIDCLKVNARDSVGSGKKCGFKVWQNDGCLCVGWRYPAGEAYSSHEFTT